MRDGLETHKIPRERTKATVIFFCVVIWTDQIIGIGMMAYIQSVTTVRTEIEYAAATKEFPDTHLEFWMVKSHCACTGEHWKISKKKMARDQIVTITMLIFRVQV